MRVAIIGVGTMGTLHAHNFSLIPGVHIDCLYSGSALPQAGMAEKYGAVVCRSEQELWNRQFDAAVITSPTASHAEYALTALQTGRHVFLEKPLARNLEDGKRILEAAAGSRGTFMVGHVLRFFHEYVHVKSLIDRGIVGKPGVARLARRARFPLGDANWYDDLQRSGGVILDMVIHDLDFLRWCFGEAEDVYARNLMSRGKHQADYALILLRFRSGLIAHVEGSWTYEGEFHSTLEIAGSAGLISYNSLEAAPLVAAIKKTEGDREAVAVPRSPVNESPYLLEAKHFVRCATEGTPPEISGEEAYQALRIALGALQSAETGEPVRL